MPKGERGDARTPAEAVAERIAELKDAGRSAEGIAEVLLAEVAAGCFPLDIAHAVGHEAGITDHAFQVARILAAVAATE